MVERVSALAGHYPVGHHGAPGEPGVIMQDLPGLVMHQIAAWPDTVGEVGALAAAAAGADAAPGPCLSATGSNGSLLRIEPLKWWLHGTAPQAQDAARGNTLDISHSRTQLRICGPAAPEFLNRHLALDLRPAAFPAGAVGSTAVHHVGVTLWHSDTGYEFFMPRGFALSLWEGLIESATQFGLEIR